MTGYLPIIFLPVIVIAGSLVMCWFVGRSIPVPAGRMLWLRFYLWLSLSLMIGMMVYSVIVVAWAQFFFEGNEPPENLPSGVVEFALTVAVLPFWVGLVYGWKLQFTFQKLTKKTFLERVFWRSPVLRFAVWFGIYTLGLAWLSHRVSPESAFWRELSFSFALCATFVGLGLIVDKVMGRAVMMGNSNREADRT